jgi:hypothetical protein
VNRYFRIQNYEYGARAGKLRRDGRRGNRLKDEKTSGASTDFHKPLTNVMDMDVILRGLRPASINR